MNTVKFQGTKSIYKICCISYIKNKLARGQTAEARRTTVLQPVEQKPYTQKDRQDEKSEGYVPDEGTR